MTSHRCVACGNEAHIMRGCIVHADYVVCKTCTCDRFSNLVALCWIKQRPTLDNHFARRISAMWNQMPVLWHSCIGNAAYRRTEEGWLAPYKASDIVSLICKKRGASSRLKTEDTPAGRYSHINCQILRIKKQLEFKHFLESVACFRLRFRYYSRSRSLAAHAAQRFPFLAPRSSIRAERCGG